ncbi:hypothetical protein ADK52_22530 [Streptomyces sp. WM6372]|nr:hypothetical protein ADK52_22530 [Streptomyces sp. WM6372]
MGAPSGQAARMVRRAARVWSMPASMSRVELDIILMQCSALWYWIAVRVFARSRSVWKFLGWVGLARPRPGGENPGIVRLGFWSPGGWRFPARREGGGSLMVALAVGAQNTVVQVMMVARMTITVRVRKVLPVRARYRLAYRASWRVMSASMRGSGTQLGPRWFSRSCRTAAVS